MNYRFTLLSVIAATLAVLLIWKLDVSGKPIQIPTGPPTGTHQPEDLFPTDDIPEQDVGGEDAHRGTEVAKTARRIKEVPFGKRDASDESSEFKEVKTITAETIGEFARHNLDAGLEGDIESAYRTMEANSRCREAPRFEAEVDLMAEAMTKRAERFAAAPSQPSQMNFSWSTTAAFPTISENRKYQRSWMRACENLRKSFGADLLVKLDEMAQRGHVIARYLFAMLPPDYLGKEDSFLVMQEWESKARYYSLQNLEQGELAGFLAFGTSYTSGKYFTPHEWHLGMAYGKAATSCGFSYGWVQKSMDTFFNYEHLPELEWNRQPEVQIMADALTELCK